MSEPSREPRFRSVFAVGIVVWGLLALAAGAAAAGHPLPAVAVAAPAVTGLAARAWARAGAGRMRARLATGVHYLFSGESLAVTIEIESGIRLPLSVEAELVLHRTRAPGAAPPAPKEDGPDRRRYALHLPGRGKHRFSVALRAEERGVYDVSLADVRAGDPPGFLKRPVSAAGAETITVFPRIGVAVRPALPSMAPLGSHRAAGAVDDPVYWIGTREYHGAGPARHIHWPATARRGVVQTRIFEPSSDRRVVIVLETAGFEDEGAAAFERMLGDVAATVVELDREGCAVDFVTDAARLDGPGQAHDERGEGPVSGTAARRLLTNLASVECRAVGSIREQLGSIRRDDVAVYFARQRSAVLAAATAPGGELARTPVTVVTEQAVKERHA